MAGVEVKLHFQFRFYNALAVQSKNVWLMDFFKTNSLPASNFEEGNLSAWSSKYKVLFQSQRRASPSQRKTRL
jgi:hypothetical protein